MTKEELINNIDIAERCNFNMQVGKSFDEVIQTYANVCEVGLDEARKDIINLIEILENKGELEDEE